MSCSVQKNFQFFHWYIRLNLLDFRITFLLMFILMSGCNPKTSSIHFYKNPETGVSLAKPNNWVVSYTERNGVVTLASQTGIFHKESARIELLAGNCIIEPNNFQDHNISSIELLEEDIDRIRMLYNLDTVNIAQKPKEYKDGNYKLTNATIMIPTMAMKDDPNRIQVGNPEPNKFQTIEINVILYKNHLIRAYFYKGNSEALNAQAQDILDSIQRDCSNYPLKYNQFCQHCKKYFIS